MADHRIGTRIKLSPLAERRYLDAIKVHGGQSKFVRDAIEFYVTNGIEVMDKIESIEKSMKRLESIEKSIKDLQVGGIALRNTESFIQTSAAAATTHFERPLTSHYEPAPQIPVITAAAPAAVPVASPAPASREEKVVEKKNQENVAPLKPEVYSTLSAFMGDDDD